MDALFRVYAKWSMTHGAEVVGAELLHSRVTLSGGRVGPRCLGAVLTFRCKIWWMMINTVINIVTKNTDMYY